MNTNKLIKVINRDSGNVGYTIPESGVRRQFASRQEREIPFSELVELTYLPGGEYLLLNYLVIKDVDAVKELFGDVEPEYFYTEKEVKDILQNGTLNEFLDCIDFAPEGVLELIKDLAVSLPLNDNNKREIIKQKLNFDVTGAIEVQNTKFDGETEAKEEVEVESKPKRRVATPEVQPTGRRAAAPAMPTASKYNIISEK